MTQISFARSERSTVGIEWELALVDRESGDLVQRAPEVLEALRLDDGSVHPKITGEFMNNTVELVTGVHRTIRSAVDDLRGQLDEVRVVTDPLDVDLICAGTHPFAQWQDQVIGGKPRYQELLDRTRWWGRQMMIWGIHVHVGIEDRAKVLPILDGLLAYYPHLQALSASSPFWSGEATGYASNRALFFQQLPTAGLPWPLADWSEYEGYVDDMLRTGVINDYSEIRWDIRPSPKWGTVEMRACDGLSTSEELAAVAALIQCLVEHLSTRLDRGEAIEAMQPWYVRENKWRAARYGLDAEIILDRGGNERLVTDDLRSLLTTLAPVAESLHCEAELDQVNLILERGASYQRQLAVAEATGGDLRAVVASLSRELRNGLTRAGSTNPFL